MTEQEHINFQVLKEFADNSTSPQSHDKLFVNIKTATDEFEDPISVDIIFNYTRGEVNLYDVESTRFPGQFYTDPKINL